MHHSLSHAFPFRFLREARCIGVWFPNGEHVLLVETALSALPQDKEGTDSDFLLNYFSG